MLPGKRPASPLLGPSPTRRAAITTVHPAVDAPKHPRLVREAPVTAPMEARGPEVGGQAENAPPPFPASAASNAHPDAGHQPYAALPAAPTFHPTAAEFANPLVYIASIRARAEPFGLALIVPPPQWTPSCALNPATFRFGTRVQRVDQLYKRYGPSQHFLACLRAHYAREGATALVDAALPCIAGIEVDLRLLSDVVRAEGGAHAIVAKTRWSTIADALRIPRWAPSREARVQAAYYERLFSYDLLTDEQRTSLGTSVLAAHIAEVHARRTGASTFGFESGRTHTLQTYKRFADEYAASWFRTREDPAPSDVEGEYWKVRLSHSQHRVVGFSVC